MSENIQKINNYGYLLAIVVLLIIISYGMYYGYNIKTDYDIIMSTFEIDDRMIDINYKHDTKAEDLYTDASDNYILEDYKGVVRNCEKAREYYSSGGQEYRNLKSELKLKKQNKVLILYQDLLEEQITITENMYEACEYLESAAKYYDIYFNTDVDTEDTSFDMGGFEIDAMNEKIGLHDDAVRRYNDILGDINAEILILE